MGKSGKKGKERHRDDRKKRRHSSDSGSDEERRRRRHKTSHKDLEGSSRKRRSRRSRSSSPEPADRWRSSKKSKREADHGTEVATPSSQGEALSLSVEETNKLRAQLGLKPLQRGGGGGGAAQPASDASGQDKSEGDASAIPKMKTVEVHAPPENIGNKEFTEKLKQKIETMKEARSIARKLANVETLGAPNKGEDVESVGSWVERERAKDQQRKLAEQRAKLLEEMDEEFGVGDLVRETMERPKQKYTSRNLQGLTVEHDPQMFKEEVPIVLTIKDRGVLDEGEDTLVNVNMLDDEHAQRNIELRKGKPGYRPYDEGDELDSLKLPSILQKYDEEIEGMKRESFALSGEGTFDALEREQERERVRERLREGMVSLEMQPSAIASEYLTPAELTAFRKGRAQRKKAKRRAKLKADDLLPLEPAEVDQTVTRDHGRRMATKKEDTEEVPDQDLLDEEDAQTNLALFRTRRLLQERKSAATVGAARVVDMVMAAPKSTETLSLEGNEEEAIVLDTTAEFCRHLGERVDDSTMPTAAGAPDTGTVAEDDNTSDMDTEETGGWAEVNPSLDRVKATKETDLYQEAEPVVSKGVAAALQMASKKGFMEQEEAGEKKRDGARVIIQGVRDSTYERDRERERERDKMSHGRDMPFSEKRDYAPEINIEYVDKLGRILTPKEAFRQMSHKFHGKGSGKKKTEKRQKRLQEEFFLNQASTVDTPLHTVEMFRRKQERGQAAYLVLSGGQQALQTPDLVKRK